MAPLVPGFEEEFLIRKEKFLTDRAEAHETEGYETEEGDRSTFHLACAATLRRDSAAVAILRGDGETARIQLREAGQTYRELGLFAGYSLLELGDPHMGMNWIRKYVGRDRPFQRLLRMEGFADDTDEPEGPRGRAILVRRSSSSPSQLLSLYQLAQTSGEVEEAPMVKVKLKSFPNWPVGSTRVPLAGYLELLDVLANNNMTGTMPPSLRETLEFIVVTRRAQLIAARQDSYHWRKLIKPADLIDMDLLCLANAALRRTGTIGPFDKVVGDRFEEEPLIALPLKAAKVLNE